MSVRLKDTLNTETSGDIPRKSSLLNVARQGLSGSQMRDIGHISRLLRFSEVQGKNKYYPPDLGPEWPGRAIGPRTTEADWTLDNLAICIRDQPLVSRSILAHDQWCPGIVTWPGSWLSNADSGLARAGPNIAALFIMEQVSSDSSDPEYCHIPLHQPPPGPGLSLEWNRKNTLCWSELEPGEPGTSRYHA